jgi:hypothetical protein
MSTVIDATFDGSVFRPAQPVELRPNTPVRLTVETVPPPEDKKASFLTTAISLKLEGPPDWSSNLDHYLYEKDRGNGS